MGNVTHIIYGTIKRKMETRREIPIPVVFSLRTGHSWNVSLKKLRCYHDKILSEFSLDVRMEWKKSEFLVLHMIGFFWQSFSIYYERHIMGSWTGRTCVV